MDKLLEFVQILPNCVELLCLNLEEKIQSLEEKLKPLKSRKDDIDDELRNAACHSGKKRKREVENWMDNVEDIKKKFETLEQAVNQSSRFHVFKRQKLAEELEKMTEDVKELVAQSESFSRLSLEVDESIDRLLLITQPNGQAFLQNFNDIWTSLMDDGILSIGIYGMGGVGKTTLARHVHDKLKESTFSGHVYWVTVSQEFTIDELQTDIARALNLPFSCENDTGKRAAQLFQAFKKKERFVLILDDVWQRIDVEKIGIPSKRGYKLVITSRSELVCLGTCKKIIKVNTLSEQEALDLFLKTLNFDERSSQVTEICKKMVNRCGGLPLALVTLAGSMRGVTDVHEWEDELEGLKESCMGQADMENEVLPILLYSYHRLRDTRLKSCFLYCSLYPEDFVFSREEFIEYFISEELMERRSSLEAEFNQGHSMLNKLLRACLLEIVSDGYLKMHDLIREMAIWITKNTPRYMVKAGLHLKELPEEQEWTEVLDKVSLMHNSIEKISPGTSPKCPSLSTLMLRGNPLRLIPDCFFTHMSELRTLDLSGTKIKSFPNSILDLEKLKSLLLGGCDRLESVPSLEKLKVLRHLDLSFTRIEEVPQGMESLTNLKHLSLEECDRLRMIPTGTLNRLTHLQWLVLPDHLPLEEVEALKQLQAFQGRLNSVRDLNRLINSRQIDKPLYFYDITIGSRKMIKLTEPGLPCKNLHFGEDGLMESSLDTDKNMLPRNIEILFFESSGLSGCLLDEFPILNSAGDLKECSIYGEDKIECIMRLEEERQSSGVPFKSLERFDLSDLPNLIGLFKWDIVARLPPGSFSCLNDLSIRGCGKIKKVFPLSLVHNFHNLQSLTVKDCVQMEKIIEDDNNEGADITLPRLKSLVLHDLPQVKSICKGKMICDSIENISLVGIKIIKKFPSQILVHDLHNLKSLTVKNCVQMEEIIEEQQSSTVVPFQSLERLHLSGLPNLIGLFKSEAVAAPLPPGTFSCLESLSIYDCGKIKKLFPRSAVHNFHNLQSLTIEDCVQMEEIIEDDNNEGANITLPRLKSLVLHDLPQVKSICKGKMICDSIENISLVGIKIIKKFPSQILVHDLHNLKSLTVKNCVQMEEIIEEQQSSTVVPFQSLERLHLSGLPNLIGLFKSEAVATPLPPGTFSCLESLSIYDCGKIKKLFPRSAVHNFHNLQSLTVEDCVQMEDIIEDDNNEGVDITLPRLKSLVLHDLPQVKNICRGKMICDSIENISLVGIKIIKKFPSQILVHDLHNLKSLTVKNCVQMEEIIEEQQSSTVVPFQSLERLHLSGLPNLIGLFKSEAVAAPLPPGTFSCLESLSIYDCGKIKKLFPRSAVHNFHNLQSLTVEDCVQMEEIIEDDNNEGADITLPRLKSLVLHDLPLVKSICKGKMSCDSIENISLVGIKIIKKFPSQILVHDLHNLKSLTVKNCVQMEEIIEEQQSSTVVPFRSLERLHLSGLPNLIGLFKSEAVAAPLPPGTFSCLESLRIYDCGKIKKLFPRSAVHNFHNLHLLNVMNCVQMEEIIEDDNNEGADIITLPRLILLRLSNLPQVKSICKGKMICDSITFIVLRGIKNIKELPLYLPLLDGQPSRPPQLLRICVHEQDKEWWESLELPQHNAKNVLQPLIKFCADSIIDWDAWEGVWR